MRPQVQALLDKLDNMKVVQETGAPEEIIWRMAFWHLHRNGEFVRLGNIANRLTALWLGTIKNEQGQPAYIFGQPENRMEWGKLTTTTPGVATGTNTSAPWERLRNWVRHYEVLMRGGSIGDEVHRAASIPDAEPGELHLEDLKSLLHQVNSAASSVSAASVSAAGDSPPEFRSQLRDFLTEAPRKEAVQDLIKEHVPKIGSPQWMIKCTCGRDYAHEDEWANHVRVRIYRAVMDEFPAIGGGEADRR